MRRSTPLLLAILILPPGLAKAELPRTGPEQVAALLAINQQLADIDQYVTTQFKKEAWARAGIELGRVLKGAQNEDQFRKVVATLRENRFRDCLPHEDYQKYLLELKRLKEDPGSAKAKPIQISQDLVETMSVLDAAYVGLAQQSDKWTFKEFSAAPLDGVEAVLEGLREHQILQRRIAKLRVFVGLPAWLQGFLGQAERDALKSASDLLAELDDSKTVQAASRLDESLKPVDFTSTLTRLIDRNNRAANASTVLTNWFNSHVAELKERKRKWVETLENTVYDIPASGPITGRPFFRAAVLHEADGRFRARLFLCRPDPRLEKTSDRKGPEGAKGPDGPKSDLHEIDLGVTLLGAEIVDKRVKLAPPGLGGDIKFDEKVIAQAIQELGWPQQLSISQARVTVNRDLSNVKIEFSTAVPGIGRTTKVAFEISPEKLAVDGDFKSVLSKELNEARKDLISSANERPVSLMTPFGPVLLSNWDASPDWSNGSIRFQASLDCGAYGVWSVPLEFRRTANGWSLHVSPNAVPGPILDKLVHEVRERAFAGLDLSGLKDDARAKADKLKDVLERLKRNLAVQAAEFDPAKGTVSATVGWTDADLLAGIALPTAGVTLNVSTRKVDVDADKLQAILKAQISQLAKRLLDRLTGKLTQNLAASLKGKSLGFFGLEMRIVDVGEFEPSMGGVPVTAGISIGTKTLTIRNLWLKTNQPSDEWKLDLVTVDFSGVSTDPPVQDFLKSVLGSAIDLSDSVVHISNVQTVKDGLKATVAVVIDALGGPLTLGEITFAAGKVGAKPDLAPILKQLGERLSKQFSSKITLPSVGPVRDLKPAVVLTDLPKLRVVVGGNLYFEGFDKISLPFENVQIFPSIDVSKIQIRIPPEIAKLLEELLPLPADSPVAVKNLKVKDDKAPYGLIFDANISILSAFNTNLRGIALTQRGLDLPDRIGIQIPGFVPIGPLAFVNPGVGIYLKEPFGKIDILGDLTIASPGIENVFAIKCSMTADLKKLQFRLTGSVILASFIPVFRVDGSLDLRVGRFDLDARTLPPIDKILDVRGSIHVDGPAKKATSSASLNVLGINLLTVNMLVDLNEKTLKFDGRVNFLLGEASISVTLSPDLSRMSASASLSFKVAGFEIAGATIDINPARTQLQFRILGFRITIIVATVSCLTPKIVLDVILSLFDFDIIGFFKALINRDVVVNLLPNKKGEESDKPPGDGDPLPPGANEEQRNDQAKAPNGQQPPAKAPGNKPESDNREDAMPTGPTPNGGWPRTPDAAKDNRPAEVVAYQPAPAKEGGSIVFQLDEKTGKFVEISKSADGKTVWESHFLIEKDVVDHLRNTVRPAMIISATYAPLPAGARVRCRNNYDHDWVPVYIMLEQDGYYLAGRYPGGTYKKLALDGLAVGDAPTPQSAWQQITDGKRPLSVGDLGLLADFATAGVDAGIQLSTVRRLSSPDGKPEDDGYVYTKSRNQAKNSRFANTTEAVFRSRKGMTFTVSSGSALYTPLTDPKSTLGGKLGNYLIRTAADNEALGLITVDSKSARAAFVRHTSKGKRVADVIDPAQGWKTAELTSDLGHHYGLGQAIWPTAGESSFPDLLAAQLANGNWEQVRLRTDKSVPRRALLSSKLDAKEWQVQLVSEGKSGAAAKAAAVTGESIGKKYQEWRRPALNSVTAKGVELFGDLTKPAQREALLNLLVGPEKDYPTYFNVNPYDLLLP
jgi:hypothetical protein